MCIITMCNCIIFSVCVSIVCLFIFTSEVCNYERTISDKTCFRKGK